MPEMKGKKTISLALAQVLGTWAFYFIADEMTIRIAIGYSLFAIAQAINRFFTTTSLQLPIKKIPH
jgi:hypothetical protein